jgi:hypothetical protein
MSHPLPTNRRQTPSTELNREHEGITYTIALMTNERLIWHAPSGAFGVVLE